MLAKRPADRVRPHRSRLPAADSLRAALDATVLSRAGRAIGVDEQGRVLGVTSFDRLRAAIRAADEAVAEQAADGRRAPEEVQA